MVAKGFSKLHEKQKQYTATISTLRNELNACRDESGQLQIQVAALQEQLRVQAENASLEELNACRNELNACRDESGQLQTQVAALQEQLKVQAETINCHITVAEWMCAKYVSLFSRQICLLKNSQEVHCAAYSHFHRHLRHFS